MRIINRSAFVVRPRDPYLHWAAALDDDPADTADDLRERVAIYLVPEDLKGENETPPIEDFYRRIFELELEAWWTDQAHWPMQRDLATFREWFEVTAESVVVDLADEAIEIEEI